MTDLSNWNYYYKYDIRGGHLCASNMLYTPMVNPEGNVMCMIWDETHPYQKDNARLTRSLIDFFFEREVKYVTRFQKYPWAAKLLEIDLANRRIFIEWNKGTLNNVLYDGAGRNLDEECPRWKDQVFEMLKTVVNTGHYKLALYPHCFFIDTDKKIKTFDFYSTLESSERYLEKSKIEGMIGPSSQQRFDSVCKDGVLDFDLFFKNTLSTQLTSYWPDNPFPEFLGRLFND